MGIDSLLSNKNATMKQLLLPFLFFFSLACGPTVVVNITDGGGSGGETDGMSASSGETEPGGDTTGSTGIVDPSTSAADSSTGHASSSTSGDGSTSNPITAGEDTGSTGTASETTDGETTSEDSSTDESLEGELYITSEDNPDSSLLLEGATHQLVANYRFTAVNESFLVEQLTIANDLSGDFDAPVLTFGANDIIIEYPDENGLTQSATGVLNGSGEATFAGLDFHVPANEDVNLEVYVDVFDADAVGPMLSGETLRLGLSTQNDITSFQATGLDSGLEITDPEITNSTQVNQFVVRENIPHFTVNPVESEQLVNSTQELFSFDVDVEGVGEVDLVKFTYVINVLDADGNGLSLNDFEVAIDGSPSNAGLTLIGGGGSLENGSHVITVALGSSEPIVGGAEISLEAVAQGVSSGDSVTIELTDGDEFSPFTNMANSFHPNTGLLVGPGDEAIFGSQVIYEITNVSTATGEPANIVWSDSSAEPHIFSTASSQGSRDWTNGYLLGINELDPVTLLAP